MISETFLWCDCHFQTLSETDDLLGFSQTPVSRVFTQNGVKNKNPSNEWWFCGWKHLVVDDEEKRN